jgi:2,3-bisphosphoglycerate-independent phosphoglycerate mutase
VILYVLVMLWQAIDDAGHDRAVKLKVRGLEAVDRAIGQLARLLWEAGKAGHYQYFICVTGDHSTPVEYGDHSFEPVPFAICRLRECGSHRRGQRDEHSS